MPQRSSIEWCTHTSNPIRYVDRNGKWGWHCEKVSAGCANCYAETLNKRFGTRLPFSRASRDVVSIDMAALDRELSAILRMRTPRDGSPVRIFVGDMTDIFGEWVPFEVIDKLWAVFALRPDITFIILTKRPERLAEYLNWEFGDSRRPTTKRKRLIASQCEEIVADWRVDRLAKTYLDINGRDELRVWPLPNVWLGASVEDQETADERIRHLLKCPAAVRLISAEPMLGPVDFLHSIVHQAEYYCPNCMEWFHDTGKDHCPNCGEDYITPTDDQTCPNCGESEYEMCCPKCGTDGGNGGLDHAECWHREIEHITPDLIHWVIVGGESGPKARLCNIAWIRSIVEQCKTASVPCFVKQLGKRPYEVDRDRKHARGFVGVDVHAISFGCWTLDNDWPRDPKGGDMSKWPEDLRVREWPRQLKAQHEGS